jgi:hypothetical protein
MCWQDGVGDVLRVVGRELVSLVLRDMSVDAIDVIVECCPSLQYLEVFGRESDESAWTMEEMGL